VQRCEGIYRKDDALTNNDVVSLEALVRLLYAPPKNMLLTILTAFLLSTPSVDSPSTAGLAAPIVESVATSQTTQVNLAQAPVIWLVFPAEGAPLDPVVLIGKNFGDLPIPVFGFIPSVPLYIFNTPRIPLIGVISVTITAVPFVFFPGHVNLTVVSNFQTSNAVDFRIL
jgi:hypothetical protein